MKIRIIINQAVIRPGAEGAGGAWAGVVQLLGVRVHRAHWQFPGLVTLPTVDWFVSSSGGARHLRWSLHHWLAVARESGEVAVIAVSDDDAVVVADHNHSRHVGCSSVPPLWSRLVYHCLILWTIFLLDPGFRLRHENNHWSSLVAFVAWNINMIRTSWLATDTIVLNSRTLTKDPVKN